MGTGSMQGLYRRDYFSFFLNLKLGTARLELAEFRFIVISKLPEALAARCLCLNCTRKKVTV